MNTILFKVIGNNSLGMGHVFRAMSLASELSTNYNIVFQTDLESFSFVEKIVTEYKIFTDGDKTILKKHKIVLVVFDILNTCKNDIYFFKKQGIKVITFEDFGTGTQVSDMTINDLYDTAQFKSNNVFWGHDYYFLREEFDNVKVNKFNKKINSILLLFGGADPNNLTSITLKTIIEICKKYNINIQIVVGSAYLHLDELLKLLSIIKYDNIQFTNSTNVVSSIMKQVDIAISSNGRTVYELAHMNIPSIIISANEREYGHNFSNIQHGFINIGKFQTGIENDIKTKLIHLIEDNKFRKTLFDNTKYFNFSKNRKKIIEKILDLINE